MKQLSALVGQLVYGRYGVYATAESIASAIVRLVRRVGR
jgi:hypothetical protein